MIVASSILAPDGTPAPELLDNATNSRHFAPAYPQPIVANSTNTYSVFCKAGQLSQVLVYGGKSGAPFTRGGMIVDLTSGDYSNADVNSPTAVTNRTVTPIANGWYRISMAVHIDATSTDGYLEVNTVSGGLSTYSGTGTEGIYIWGAQVEQGAAVGSYIPTTTGTVTRSADTVTIPTGPWLSTSHGTLYAQFIFPFITSNNEFIAELNDGTSNNRLSMYIDASGNFQGETSLNGSTLFSQSEGSLAASQTNQTAISFQAGNFISAVNGTGSIVNSLGSLPNITQLVLGAEGAGTAYLNGWLQIIQYYDSNLSPSQIQQLSHTGLP